MLNTVKNIINKRVKLHEEDYYRIEECRNELMKQL